MRALIVTHGNLGEALLESSQAVFPQEAPIKAISNSGLSAAALQALIEEWLAEDDASGLIFVDIGSGSCGIASRMASVGRGDVWILGGVNLAMILTYISSWNQIEGKELITKILDRALNAVQLLGEQS